MLQTVAVDGSDPSGEREAFRAAPTMNDLLDRYIKEHVERRNRIRTQTSFKGRDPEQVVDAAVGLDEYAARSPIRLHGGCPAICRGHDAGAYAAKVDDWGDDQ